MWTAGRRVASPTDLQLASEMDLFLVLLGHSADVLGMLMGWKGGRDGGGRVPSSCAPGEIPEFPVLASEGVISLLATVTVATCAHANVL